MTSILITFNFYSQRYVGEIELAKDKQSTANDISNGLPLIYRVRFPVQNPVPLLSAIYYNDQLLCSGAKGKFCFILEPLKAISELFSLLSTIVGQYLTTITLDHTFTTGFTHQLQPQENNRPSQNFNQGNQGFQGNQGGQGFQGNQGNQGYQGNQGHQVIQVSPTQHWEISQTQTTRPRPSYTTTPAPQPDFTEDRFEYDFECGVPDYRPPISTGLVVNGKNAHRGQFPW